MISMKNSVSSLYETCGCFVATLVVIVCIAFIVALLFGIFCFQGWVFMLLWNWLAVDLFSAHVLGYWTCVGIVFALNFLGKLIFGRTVIKKND